MKTFKTMLKNEMKLSLRDMNMVIFAICIPLVVLIILGVIYGNKPVSPGAAYNVSGTVLWSFDNDCDLCRRCYGTAPCGV